MKVFFSLVKNWLQLRGWWKAETLSNFGNGIFLKLTLRYSYLKGVASILSICFFSHTLFICNQFNVSQMNRWCVCVCVCVYISIYLSLCLSVSLSLSIYIYQLLYQKKFLLGAGIIIKIMIVITIIIIVITVQNICFFPSISSLFTFSDSFSLLSIMLPLLSAGFLFTINYQIF